MNEHLLSDRRGEVDTGPRKGTRHHWEDWKHTRECRTVVGKRELRYAQVSPVSKETQCKGKRDLLGSKRDLLNTGIPELCAQRPSAPWFLYAALASVRPRVRIPDK